MHKQNICTHSIGYYSHKMNEVLVHATTWVNFKNVMLNERN